MLRNAGALIIDKPEGLTSSDVVFHLKKALSQNGYFEKGFKIGHGGTLDPFATGVLVVLLGEATKLADAYLHSKKAYSGIIRLGARTNTGDGTGTLVEEKAVPTLSAEEWNRFASRFVSEPYLQTPPMYSSKKIDGQRLHELAREGKEVERKAILKKIDRFTILPGKEPNELSFIVECESGTYVRVIAEDLAQLAGTSAHLKTLQRIRSSDAVLENCATLETTVAKLNEKITLQTLVNYVSLDRIASHLPVIPLSPETAALLRQGIQRAANSVSEECAKTFSDARYVLVKEEAGPVALFENQGPSQGFRLQRIFNRLV